MEARGVKVATKEEIITYYKNQFQYQYNGSVKIGIRPTFITALKAFIKENEIDISELQD
ncbi:MAG: hypothetical protein ACYC27_03245 [Armatimonadota bacterium]